LSYVTTSNVAVQPFVTSVSQVAAGLYHSCAKRSAGTISCWGSNASGQFGYGSFIGFSPPGPAAPLTTTINPVQTSGISTATATAAGAEFGCARLSDSTVFCWGSNAFGQLGSGTGISLSTPVQVTN